MNIFNITFLITLIIMSFILGVAFKFYDKFFWWDKLIHFLSGITFVCVGIDLYKKIDNLSNVYIILFSFTLSITINTIWEVIEYTLDCFFNTDNQRWQKKHKTINHLNHKNKQPAGLIDTMNDTILCMISSLITCVIWFFIL